MRSDPEAMAREIPGTVIGASFVAGISAIIGLFFPPLGWLFTAGYVVAAIALYRLQVWAYWTLLFVSGIGWIVRAAQGHFEVIGTGIIIVLLLLTPSARSAFAIGRYASLNAKRESSRPNLVKSVAVFVGLALVFGGGWSVGRIGRADPEDSTRFSLALGSARCFFGIHPGLGARSLLLVSVDFRYHGADSPSLGEYPGITFIHAPGSRFILDDRTRWPGTSGSPISPNAARVYDRWVRGFQEAHLGPEWSFDDRLQTAEALGQGVFRLLGRLGQREKGGGTVTVLIALFSHGGTIIEREVTIPCPTR